MLTHWIDNRSVTDENANAIDVLNPSTEQRLDTIPEGTGFVDAAVGAARRAQAGWAKLSPSQRKAFLVEAAARVEAHAQEIVDIFVAENGKPRREAAAEVQLAVGVLRTYAELAVHVRTGVQGSAAGDLVFQHRGARGVCACIVPWNFPVAIVMENLAPNLAMGNAVVVKPSEKTPMATRVLAELGFGHFPAGVVNVLLGSGPTGAALVNHEDVDLVVFVGSERTGRYIGEVCGRRLCKVVLELGGKDPMIVDETVDVAVAAKLAVATTYANAGQICTSTERIYVQSSVFDQFLEELQALSMAQRVGPGTEEATTVGPLIDRLQLEKVASQVEDAVQRGASIHCGGHRVDRPGYFYRPTVLTGITDEMTLMREETFGPVAPLIPFDDFEEGLSLANSSRYGLAAIVCTTSPSRAMAAIERLDAGMVKINTTRGKAEGGTSEPFKASGIGHGYGVEFLNEISRQKSIHWRATL